MEFYAKTRLLFDLQLCHDLGNFSGDITADAEMTHFSNLNISNLPVNPVWRVIMEVPVVAHSKWRGEEKYVTICYAYVKSFSKHSESMQDEPSTCPCHWDTGTLAAGLLVLTPSSEIHAE